MVYRAVSLLSVQND